MKLFRKAPFSIDWSDSRNRRAYLIRVWINVFHSIGFDFFPLPAFFSFGISFWRKGDEVIWIFPWKRTKENPKKWYSLDFCSGCDSLEEVTAWNKEYQDYSNKQYEDYLDFCKKPHETDSNQ